MRLSFRAFVQGMAFGSVITSNGKLSVWFFGEIRSTPFRLAASK